MLANVLVFVMIAVVGGLGSSWYMIERGSALTTRSFGPWSAWVAAGRSDADPYTRAHFMRRGMLPVSSALAVTFEAVSDSDGQRLHSSCEYVVDGDEPPGRFWSLSVFDENGGLIPNPAERYSYNSATLLKGAGGRMTVAIARSARPGNWLPTGGAGRLALMLTVEELREAGEGQAGRWRPPQIRRVTCR
ncbi:MAG: DUF1214 domain-containing protein [Hyphomicrobiaceae bacterium]|nr:DUF1214 domain-containing protein [Hyphomicrobiaceae bacterium]